MAASNIPPLRTSWLKHLRGRALNAMGRVPKTKVSPSPTEAATANRALHEALRPAVFGELGGVRPDPSNRHASWWGGCALGSAEDEVPQGKNRKPMQPILQVRMDEIGTAVPGLENIALLTLWLDLDGNIFHPVEGEDFVVSTFSSLDELVPLGPGYRENNAIPTFPVRWNEPVPQQPSGEDFSHLVPSRVAWFDTSRWFFDNPVYVHASELQAIHPVKIGGWPTWIHGSQWRGADSEEDFVLQIDSTQKGNIGFGDGGSIYLFRNKQNGSWTMRCDFF
ncbi:DUF1963 domain-containing protein [Pseudahrensia aquimaris]|uniref:DUF1963 domain-containing protein n=1 Tax=Pseudahrensia aquimaris TaxID=744461 RepID=A0ABW3FFB8_9HYPH